MRRNNKGFTLVELLVVIAIIAVLAGALLIAINPQAMIQKSNDATRMQDMETLAKAINLALADGQITLVDTTGVCATCTSDAGTQAVDGTGWVQLGTGTLQRFIATLPVDPVNTAPNTYSYASDGSDYELNCVFEHADNAGKLTTDGGDNDTSFEVGTSLILIN